MQTLGIQTQHPAIQTKHNQDDDDDDDVVAIVYGGDGGGCLCDKHLKQPFLLPKRLNDNSTDVCVFFSAFDGCSTAWL